MDATNILRWLRQRSDKKQKTNYSPSCSPFDPELHRGVGPLRAHETLTTQTEGRARERLGELISCVSSRVDVFHGNDVRFDLLHEKVNTYQKMPDPLVIAGKARSQLDERFVVDPKRTGRVYEETKLCQHVTEID